MPKRSNLFQDVIAIIHRHSAGEARVEESAMLPHSTTGELREVDVTITSLIAGHPVTVAVEATAAGRPADIKWVEQLVSKHQYLPTDKLVLVASGGFTASARTHAEAMNAVPIAPEDLSDDENPTLSGLFSYWALAYQLQPERVRTQARLPADASARPVLITDSPDVVDVVTPEGARLCSLAECAVGVLRALTADAARFASDFGLVGLAEDASRPFTYELPQLEGTVNGQRMRFCLEQPFEDGSSRIVEITRMVITGRVNVTVREMPISRMRVGGTPVAFAPTEVLGQPAIFVVTGFAGEEVSTLRVQDSRGKGPAIDYRGHWIGDVETCPE